MTDQTLHVHEVASIGDLLARNAMRAPDRAAIVVDDDRHTHSSLFEAAVARARSLVALDIDSGDRVGILMANSMDFVEVLLGAWMVGAVAVPINARFRTRELRHVVPDADVEVLVTSDVEDGGVSFPARIVEAFEGIADHDTGDDGLAPLALGHAPRLRHVLTLGVDRDGFVGRAVFEELASSTDEATVHHMRARTPLRAASTVFYTSGTTSLPKGCVLTQEAIVRQGMMTADRFGFVNGESLFSPLPMFHTAFTQAMFAVLARVGTYLNTERFDADTALRVIADEGVTALYTAFPPVTEALLNAPSYGPDSFRDVRILFNVSPPDALRAIQARLPHTTLVNGYGMTEFSGSVVLTDPDAGLEDRLSQGPPLAGCEIEVRDLDTGDPAPIGVVGEICGRGPALFEGYLNAPERNAESFDDAGWFRTGDLGFLDDRGQLHFRGRLKDMLKIGGENVACIEIETHLQAHPAVQIAAVVGMPDDRLDEVAAAFVELRPGATATEQEILDHCDGAIASFKVPRVVRFVGPDEWPMSATKIRKDELKRWLVEQG